jgi:predicted nucleic acid-binding protein
MLHSSDIFIVDTSGLILLNKIDELELLNKLGKEIFITTTIRAEFGMSLPEWISTTDPGNKHYQNILKMELDEGEASAIALSLETANSILILDDLKGRKVADRLKLKYSGTLGLILGAKKVGILKSVKPVLDKIRSTDFRFSDELLETVRTEAGEGNR